MKLLFLLLSLWGLSFAQDNPIRVFVNLAQSAQIAPDIYILTLTISAEADKEVKALSLLGRVDRELNQLGLPYSGGNYWVDRKCFMEKNTQKCEGFRAQAFISVQIKGCQRPRPDTSKACPNGGHKLFHPWDPMDCFRKCSGSQKERVNVFSP
jgi:hypothetical protein